MHGVQRLVAASYYTRKRSLTRAAQSKEAEDKKMWVFQKKESLQCFQLELNRMTGGKWIM